MALRAITRSIPLVLLFVLFTLTVSACTGSPAPNPSPTPSHSPDPIRTSGNASPSPSPQATTIADTSPFPAVADVVELVKPSVVFISVEYVASSSFFESRRTKTGSGVIINPDGYILTNNHVVEDAIQVEVVLPEQMITYEAEVIGTDPLSDLAVIKIEGQDFPATGFADTSNMRIGDWVIAIGNALGLEGGPSVTVGIVSNLERNLPLGESRFYDIIQTDAAINPGNSGGPLVDLQGRVVGINTFILSSAQNIGFAVNASTASRVYDDLLQHGYVTRPYLGVRLQTLTPDIASDIGLARNIGVLVTFVEPDGPSAEAGLQVNDVITGLADEDMDEASHLIRRLWLYHVGDSIKLTFWREGEQHEAWVTLEERPAGL